MVGDQARRFRGRRIKRGRMKAVSDPGYATAQREAAATGSPPSLRISGIPRRTGGGT